MKKDPVCGAVFDVREASAIARHRGRYYYFCSLRCRDAFQRAPGPFAEARASGQHRAPRGRLAGR